MSQPEPHRPVRPGWCEPTAPTYDMDKPEIMPFRDPEGATTTDSQGAPSTITDYGWCTPSDLIRELGRDLTPEELAVVQDAWVDAKATNAHGEGCCQCCTNGLREDHGDE